MALWYCVPCAFLLAYVLGYSEPVSAIGPHLQLASLPLLTIFATRLVLERSPATAGAYFLVTSILTSTLLALMVVYYAIVLIGLHSWGGVVAWNVVPTFFLQTTMLTEAWNVPRVVIIAVPLLVYWLIIQLCKRYFDRIDWVPFLVPRMSPLVFGTAVFGLVAVIVTMGLEFSSEIFVRQSEPLSLTVFPPSAGMDLEGYVVNPVRASRMDVREDAARDQYTNTGALPGLHRKNLVFILVDALRPDHMSGYGYERNTTPNVDRLTHEHSSRVFQRVHSTCADTACSIFSLFSSQFPGSFAAHPFMLHHVLWRNGYRIHLILSGDKTYFYSRRQYYGDVDTFYDGTQAPGFYINDDQLVIDKLATMPKFDGTPVMFQSHLMSAHILRKRDKESGPFQPSERYLFPENSDLGPGGDELPGPRNFYDNGVVKADEVIGKLVSLLKDKGYLENTLLVITADHGESLGEHGLYHHANSVREEVLSVPWIMISFGEPLQLPVVVRRFASQVDIAPTVLEGLKVAAPTSWSGRALQTGQILDVSFFTEHEFHGLIDHRDIANVWKYTQNQNTGVERVFNLSTDPHENSDLVATVSVEKIRDWRSRMKEEFAASLPVR